MTQDPTATRDFALVRASYVAARSQEVRLSGRVHQLQDAKIIAGEEFDAAIDARIKLATETLRSDLERLRLELVSQESLDTTSSASIQHYVETGHYLPAGNANGFQNALASEIFDVLNDRETDRSIAAAAWVKDNEDDALWDRFVGPMLDQIEDVAHQTGDPHGDR